jgi:hypothetical protein
MLLEGWGKKKTMRLDVRNKIRRTMNYAHRHEWGLGPRLCIYRQGKFESLGKAGG